jgi:hypothetical protein
MRLAPRRVSPAELRLDPAAPDERYFLMTLVRLKIGM